MPNEGFLDRVGAQLARGSLFDGAFDQLLPPHTRSQSRRHWSPMCVARRAARRFVEHGAKRVLDVGSGPGKFCIVAASAQPELEFHGIEQRPELAASAAVLAERLKLRNVEFSAGDALLASWPTFDGFYFFNPFAADAPRTENAADEGDELSLPRFGTALLRVAKLLATVRQGAVVITYHGLGGLIPSSYDLVREEPVGSGCLRTWIKTRSSEAAWYYLEQANDVSRAPREDVDPAHSAAPRHEPHCST